MNLSDRDKKVVLVGGVLALAIVVVGYGVIPLLRSWSGSSAAQSSQAAYVSEWRERIDSQGVLVKQRNALVRRMGSLFEAPPDKPGQKKGDEKPSKPAAEKKDGAQTPESPKPVTAGGAQTPESPASATPAKDATLVAAVQSPESPKPAAPAKDAEPPKPDGEKKDAAPAAAAQSPETPKPGSKPEGAQPGKPDEKKAGEKKDEKPRPEPVGGATLAAYVEQNAKKAEATVKSITPLKSTAGFKNARYYRPVMLQVKVQCKAKGLLALLQALENGERFVKVEQVQVHREPNKDDMDVTLDVRAYESVGKAS